MSAMLSVSASAADRVATCILDARLALAPGGLVLALQLARAGPVWLTRRFWALVDGAYFYRRYPEELVPRSADTKSDSGSRRLRRRRRGRGAHALAHGMAQRPARRRLLLDR